MDSDRAPIDAALAESPARAAAQELFLVVAAAALTALAAQVALPLPWTPVPWTLQPMAVLFTAALLGPRRAALAQMAYLVAGAAGAPVFAATPLLPQGLARLLGPTGGYLLAYVPAAALVGALAARWAAGSTGRLALAMGAGLALVHAGGAAWLAVVAGGGLAFAAGAGILPFLAGDLLKVLVAAAAVSALSRRASRA